MNALGHWDLILIELQLRKAGIDTWPQLKIGLWSEQKSSSSHSAKPYPLPPQNLALYLLPPRNLFILKPISGGPWVKEMRGNREGLKSNRRDSNLRTSTFQLHNLEQFISFNSLICKVKIKRDKT